MYRGVHTHTHTHIKNETEQAWPGRPWSLRRPAGLLSQRMEPTPAISQAALGATGRTVQTSQSTPGQPVNPVQQAPIPNKKCKAKRDSRGALSRRPRPGEPGSGESSTRAGDTRLGSAALPAKPQNAEPPARPEAEGVKAEGGESVASALREDTRRRPRGRSAPSTSGRRAFR